MTAGLDTSSRARVAFSDRFLSSAPSLEPLAACSAAWTMRKASGSPTTPTGSARCGCCRKNSGLLDQFFDDDPDEAETYHHHGDVHALVRQRHIGLVERNVEAAAQAGHKTEE